MSPDTLKKLFFPLLFLFLPLIAFAQSNRAESVALVPFWGDDEKMIKEFGEELYKSVNGIPGYRSVAIDMDPANLPSDVPEGGFPPYICPQPSLIKTNPIAVTGELVADPDDDELYRLRLYLWEMKENRLVFSDELYAYDRGECAERLGNGGPDSWIFWLFDWIKKSRSGSGDEDSSSNQFGLAREVFRNTSMPLYWIYIGARVGITPLRMQAAPKWDNPDTRYVNNYWETLSVALSFNVALFPESVPFFSGFVVQGEALFNYDFEPNTKSLYPSPPAMTLIPAALLKYQVYREGDMLLSIFGGAYTPVALDSTLAYSAMVPIGWTAGASFGGKFEKIPGIFFVDLRFSRDEWFNTYVTEYEEGYKRNSVTISVGYKYGLIKK